MRLEVFAAGGSRYGPQFVVAFADGGKKLATWDARGQLIVREVATGKVLRGARFPAFRFAAAFSPDGSRLAVRTGERTLRVQQVTGDRAVVLPLPEVGREAYLSWSPDGTSIALMGGSSCLLLDPKTGKSVTAHLRQRPDSQAAFSPDGKKVAVAWHDGITIYESATGKLVKELLADELSVLFAVNLVYLTNERLLLLRWGVGTVLDVRTCDQLPKSEAHARHPQAFAFTNDCKTLATAGFDGVIHLWDTKTGILKGSPAVPHGRGGAGSLCFAGGVLAHGSDAPGTVSLLDVSSRKWDWHLETPLPHCGHLPFLRRRAFRSALAMSGDGELLAIKLPATHHSLACSSHRFDVYQTRGKKRLWTIRNEPVGAACFSPERDTFALAYAADDTFTFRLLDAQTGKVHRTFTHTDTETVPLAQALFSPDGRVFVALGQHRLYLVERVTGGLVTKATVPARFEWESAAFTADGHLLLAGTRTYGGAVRAAGPAVYDLSAEAFAWSRQDQPHGTSGLALSPDGRVLAVGQMDTSTLLYDIPRLTRRKSPEPTAHRLRSLWDDLASNNAARGQEARRAFADHPGRALPLLRERVKPAKGEWPRKLLADLDSEEYAVRRAAMKKLAEALKRGDRIVEVALRDVVESKPSLEVYRRASRLLEQADAISYTADEVRLIRAVAVLEDIGSADAIAHLKQLAAGAPSVQGAEAKAALKRLGAR